MTRAFCPGHITCFFHPVRTDSPETTGSRGVGLRLSKGTWVTLEERSDRDIRIIMDGTESSAPITRDVLSQVCPGAGFDVIIENDLPVSQGFGMSASGAIAVAMAACVFSGRDTEEAYRYAHIAEVRQGGGLGDVTAIQSNCGQPVRIRPGLPPNGLVEGTGVDPGQLTLAVTGKKLSTSSIITDPEMQRRLNEIGSGLVDKYVKNPSSDLLFRYSREFSSSMGLESQDVRDALDKLNEKGKAGMCMLGHSVFTTIPEDEVRDILGNVPVFSVSLSDRPAFIQKG